MMIECKKLTVYRENSKILSNFSLEIKAGEHVAILGPNGAGKSTFLRLLTRDLYPVYTENAHFSLFGKTLWNIFELRHNLGILSLELQEDMPKHLNAEEIVLSGFDGVMSTRALRKFTQEERQKADLIIKRTGIEKLRKKRIDQMSSGEQRRCLLARALVNHPQMLIFDEPTANLDLQMSSEYLSLIREEIARGTTIVMVTHHIHEIPPEINRVVLMKKGHIIADAQKSKLLTSSRLSKLFEVPLTVKKYHGFFYALFKEKTDEPNQD